MSKATPAREITQDILKNLLNYNPSTGVFTWKTNNKRAGGLSQEGYWKIGVLGARHFAHRLAWLYTEGYLPENEIDHINRIRHDNRRENLREVSKSCNVRNSGIAKNNKSGVTGVSWDRRANKWRAQIKSCGLVENLGAYNDLRDAVLSRWLAEVKHRYPNCNTISSARKYLIDHGIDVDNMK